MIDLKWMPKTSKYNPKKKYQITYGFLIEMNFTDNQDRKVVVSSKSGKPLEELDASVYDKGLWARPKYYNRITGAILTRDEVMGA